MKHALAMGLAVAGLMLVRGAHAQEAAKVSASSSVYVRSDTDETTVVTPRIELGAPVTDETHLDLTYSVDVWTSASVDIRTSASIGVGSATPSKVTEQRDEIDVALEQAISDVTLGASYRYSVEHDYESNGGGLGGALDFADNSANIALSFRAYFDTIGRAGAPGFEEESTLYNARLSYTQVIDPKMVAALVYEVGIQDGYLSSPYRFVRFAPANGPMESTCVNPITLCLPESNPDSRVKHAIALNARRALTDEISVGANYRFYLDTWDLSSHTIGIDGALMPADGWLLSLGYRFYTQSSASHFKTFYVAMPFPKHYTSDKELSEMSSHRLELEVTKKWELDDLGSELSTVLLVAPSHFLYHEFLLVDSISALEVTLGVEVAL